MGKHLPDTMSIIKGGIDIDYLLKKLDGNVPVRITAGSDEHNALIISSQLACIQLIYLFNTSRAIRRGKGQRDKSTLRPQSIRRNKMMNKRFKRRDDMVIRYLKAKGIDIIKLLHLSDEEKAELQQQEV